MSIEEVAQQLYGLVPEEFTAARNARAKEARAAGDTELAARVQGLRKPTTAAWLVNQLVRGHGEEVQQVLELGARLRSAQGTLAADELRDLDRQRRQLTRAVAEQARDLGRQAGRRVTDQATAEVEETLRSAMVDPAAGAALSTGLLTDTFSSTGLGPVDLSRVVALAPAGGGPATSPSDAAPAADDPPDPGHRRRVAQAEGEVAEAESALRTAHEVSERAAKEAAAARQHREVVESQREEARRRLHDLDGEVAAATEVEETARRVHEAAAGDEASTAESLDRRRERLEALLG